MLRTILATLLTTTTLALASDEAIVPKPMDDMASMTSEGLDNNVPADIMDDASVMEPSILADGNRGVEKDLMVEEGLGDPLEKIDNPPIDEMDVGTDIEGNMMPDELSMRRGMGEGDMIQSAPGSSMGGGDASGIPAGTDKPF